ncbi:MAG: fatty acid desaturase [Flavobacteriales bacterium]|nr:fatty acid desaturase [Flavobacteriales bacterium]
MTRSRIVRYKADYRTLATVFGYGIYTIASWFIYPHVSTFWKVMLFVVHCNVQFVLFCIIHNTIHSPIFRKKKWNKAFQYYLTMLCGNQVSGFVPGHNLSHHMHLQTPKDTSRTTRARFEWNFLNQSLFFFFMAFDIIKMEQKFKAKMKETQPDWYRQYFIEALLVKGIKLTLLLIDWQRALVLIIVPGLYGIWGLFGTNFWQHDGCDETHPYNHSRNFTGKLFNWMVFNNGFHGAHHMKPGLHWSLYPKYHEENLAPFVHPNLNRKHLSVYLWQTLIWPGKRVDYLGNPVVLPEDRPTADWVEDLDNSEETRSAMGAVQ